MIPPHLLAEAKAAWKTETFDTSNDKECFLAGAEFMFSRLREMSWEFSANEFQEMADAIPLETWLTIPKTSARKLVDHYRAIDQAALLKARESCDNNAQLYLAERARCERYKTALELAIEYLEPRIAHKEGSRGQTIVLPALRQALSEGGS